MNLTNYIRNFSSNSTTHKKIECFGFTWLKPNEDINSSERVNLDKAQLVINFKSKFREFDLNDWDSINRFINISKEGKAFYSDYKKFVEAVGSMPQEFIDSGVSIDQWNEISARKTLRKNLLSDHSIKSSRLSNDYDNSLTLLNDELTRNLSKFTGLERLIGLGAENLTTPVKVRLSKISDVDERRHDTKIEISLRITECVKHFLSKGTFPADFQ